MHRNEILLGHESASPAFGFDKSSHEIRPISYSGDAPICCIAATGAGKGRDLIIPVALSTPANLICLDFKGEIYAVTHRRRREMGQRVAVLDPFGVTGATSDSLNPFDLFSLPGAQPDCDAEMLASLLATGHEFATDPFWTDTATSLITGYIGHIQHHEPPESRTLNKLRSHLHTHDMDYHLAILLDGLVSLPPEQRPQFAYDELAAYLNHPSDKTRPCVLSTAVTYVKGLGAASVAKTLERSTISLADVVSGAPLSIYIVVPPSKSLKSHRSLLRLWVGVLLTAIMSRKAMPERKTLAILDEAAALGKEFEPLLTGTTMLRGYGLQLLTVWQDVAQIKSRYPNDWQTILNNSGALIAFGMGHYAAAKDYAELVGLDPHELLKMPPDQAVLSLRGQGTRVVKRMNYLNDRMFAGKADPNPFYARKAEIGL